MIWPHMIPDCCLATCLVHLPTSYILSLTMQKANVSVLKPFVGPVMGRAGIWSWRHHSWSTGSRNRRWWQSSIPRPCLAAMISDHINMASTRFFINCYKLGWLGCLGLARAQTAQRRLVTLGHFEWHCAAAFEGIAIHRWYWHNPLLMGLTVQHGEVRETKELTFTIWSPSCLSEIRVISLSSVAREGAFPKKSSTKCDSSFATLCFCFDCSCDGSDAKNPTYILRKWSVFTQGNEKWKNSGVMNCVFFIFFPVRSGRSWSCSCPLCVLWYVTMPPIHRSTSLSAVWSSSL